MSKKQSQAVILEGTRFDSICAAAAYLKTDPSCIQLSQSLTIAATIEYRYYTYYNNIKVMFH